MLNDITTSPAYLKYAIDKKLPVLNDPNDTELAVLLRQGDVKAFDTLYHRYYTALYRNIFLLTKDSIATQDLLQDVFTTLWDRRSAIDPGRSISGWLFVMSHRRSIDWLRKKLKTAIVELEPEQETVTEASTDWQTEEHRIQLLKEAILRLSPQKRKVFELCKVEGKTYEETARELDLSKHTVKEYLTGALGNIRQYIQQHIQIFF